MVDKDTTIRILGYAKNGFLQNGYQGTSLANICGQAGVTTALYIIAFQARIHCFVLLLNQHPMNY